MSSPRTILVADDETHILNVVSLKLRNGGFRVITAQDGAEALELAAAEKPDLLITDYHMPRLNGLELCARLRADAASRSLPIILLSARGHALESGDMEAYGILHMLSKPFSPRQLLQTVHDVLDACGRGEEKVDHVASSDPSRA